MSILVVAAGALLLHGWPSKRDAGLEAPSDIWRTTAITSYPGYEQFPSLSPDEQRVAFSWRRETSDNLDIYVQQIRSGTPVQLTTDPRHEWSPAWSPDGGSIAFIRFSPGSAAELVVMPALPGSERRLTTIAPLPVRAGIYGSFLAWSPDGAWIATSDNETENDPEGLFIISATTAEKRRLTRPGPGQRDTAPAFAPDGRSLAFVRVVGFGISEIYRLPLTRELQPAGEPAPQTASRRMSTSPTWISAGSEVVFSSGDVFTDRRLYRIRVSGPSNAGPIQHVPVEIPDTTVIATNRHMTRILYAREFFDPNIWQLDRLQVGRADTRVFASSTWIDLYPQFSRDGTRVAFESNRTGSFEIWTAREDGSQAVQLTSMGGPPTSSPSWSPDGRRIAFNSGAAGQSHVYVIESVNGSTPRRLTADDESESAASWSSDGRWIYFSSTKGGAGQIWKIRVPEQGTAPQGSAIQVTRNGGIRAVEWAGKTLYFSKAAPGGISLWEMNLASGEEREVLPSLNDASAFAVSAGGIFFVPRTNLTRAATVEFLDFKDRSTSTVVRAAKPTLGGMSAHPNGRSLLYSQIDREEADLILSEKVR